MQKWDEKVLEWKRLAQKAGRDVEFVYWGTSELFKRLSQTEHAGRRAFWFGETEVPEPSFESIMAPSFINERFVSVSSTLRNYPAYFDNLDRYHIDRIETNELLSWIKEPLQCTNKTKSLNPEFAPPIAILSGDAGFGKTVVMHDMTCCFG